MGEVIGLLALVLLGIAVVCVVTYLILKAAAYFKRTYGKSLWPGVVSMCFALDLTIAAAMCSQEEFSNELIPILIIAAVVLLGYALYRDIRYYRIYAIPAILLQLLLAVVQVVILLIVIMSYMAKRSGIYRSERVRRRAERLGYIINI